MDNILDRISQISHLEGISIGKIELIIGASKGVLYKAIQKNTDIQAKWIIAVAENFPQYSPEWILLGRGEKKKNSESISMLSDVREEYGKIQSENDKKEKTIEALENTIYHKNQIIAGLERETKLLWKLLDGEDNNTEKKSLG